jgi:hypothetical protein
MGVRPCRAEKNNHCAISSAQLPIRVDPFTKQLLHVAITGILSRVVFRLNATIAADSGRDRV